MGLIDRLRRTAFGGRRQKVPTILQMEGTECGAASLAMILAHYGQWVPLEKLRAECGVNRDGSKAGAIMRAARARGCEARGMQSRAEHLTKLGFPLIIHWNFNHFLVLEGIEKGRAYLNDPAVGRRSVPWEEFRTSFTGIVMKITPGAGFKKEGAPYNVVKEVAGKLKEDKWSMIFISCIALGMIFPGLAQPVFNQIFLDEIMTAKHPDWMFNLMLGMVLTVVLLLTMTSLRAAVLTKWQKKLTLADSSKFFWHILRLPMQFFQQRYAAEVASRISFNESVASVLSDAAATSVLDLLVALFFLALLFQYSVTLTLIGIATSAISIGVFLLLRRKITDLNMRMQQETGKEYGTLMNGIMMIESIKASGAEADIFGKWAGYHAKVLSATQEVEIWSLSASALPVFLASLNTALILTIGGFSIMEGLMTTGIYMAFQNLMGNFQAPVNKLVGLGTSLQTTEMQMRRLDDVRRYEVDDLHFGPQTEVDAAQLKELHRLSGALVLKDITFGYSPLEKPLLSDFNLTLAPGRWVAVVGASGSGKSTVAKLIAGLYEQWSGEVLFDGQPRRSIPRALLVGSVGVVDQDIFLLSGTVRENISLFDSAVSLDDVTQAARDACIHEDIMHLDGGYESMVSEGGRNFSGGQRQRLEIARTLAKKPALLVLDEATSALDPVTEKEVLKNIRRRGCSCFIVAHRLSTIRDCDEIIVLSQGQVVERGTHREMIAHDGPYSHLVREKNKEE